MFMTKKVALFVASAVLAVSSVSAGSVRGVTDNSTTKQQRGRDLKKDQQQNNKNNQNNPMPVPVFTTPTGTRAPVEPPKPVGYALWQQNCSNNTFRQCLSRNRAQETTCAQCLYALGNLNTQSTSGITSCGKNMCGGCVDEAMTFFMCGKGKSAPTPPPATAPTPAVTIPETGTTPDMGGDNNVITPPAPTPTPVKVDTEYTSLNCPVTKPSPGASCVVPSGFKYQRCGYPTGMNNMEDQCVCAYGSFMCISSPISPTAAPVPVPVAPIPPGTADPGVCSPSLPRSGDECLTGGMDFTKCCYSIPEAGANYAYVCNCLNSEKRYMCFPGTKAECGSIIKPIDAVPETMPEVAVPETMPEVAAPGPATTTAVPDPVPVTAQGECPPQNTPPNTGDDCATLFSTGSNLTSVTCRYWQSYTDSSGVANTSESLCTCPLATKMFTCDGKIAPVPENISNGPEMITATGPGTGTGIMSTGSDSMSTGSDSMDTTASSSTSTDNMDNMGTATTTTTDSEGNMASSINTDDMGMTGGSAPMDPSAPAHSGGGANALCPSDSEIVDGQPCRQFIPFGANEASCFVASGQQCNCPGQESADPLWMCRSVR